MRVPSFAIGLLAAAAVFPAVVQADDTNFEAVLSGAEEVPPVDTEATGMGTMVLNEEGTMLSFEITFEGFTSPETAAHFHNAPMGESGSPVFTLPAGSPKIGTWEISSEMRDELLAGRIYVNIHSEDHPGGEIRGQVEKLENSPTEETTWGRIKSLY
jgi:hypothetical protein